MQTIDVGTVHKMCEIIDVFKLDSIPASDIFFYELPQPSDQLLCTLFPIPSTKWVGEGGGRRLDIFWDTLSLMYKIARPVQLVRWEPCNGQASLQHLVF